MQPNAIDLQGARRACLKLTDNTFYMLGLFLVVKEIIKTSEASFPSSKLFCVVL